MSSVYPFMPPSPRPTCKNNKVLSDGQGMISAQCSTTNLWLHGGITCLLNSSHELTQSCDWTLGILVAQSAIPLVFSQWGWLIRPIFNCFKRLTSRGSRMVLKMVEKWTAKIREIGKVEHCKGGELGSSIRKSVSNAHFKNKPKNVM